MNLHVQRLHYRAIPPADGSYSYEPTAEADFMNRLGHFRISNAELTVEPTDHFSSPSEARAVIQPFLRAWVIDTHLRTEEDQIRFEYVHADIVDQDSAAIGNEIVVAPQVSLELKLNPPRFTTTSPTYPDPPSAFEASMDVETAYWRWQQYRAGREPLQSTAYFVLTLLESMTGAARGQRPAAARQFAIAYDVLQTVGKWTATKGDARTARKAPFVALTGHEEVWLKCAVRLLIRRMGEYAAGVQLIPITMKDLP